MLLKSPEEIDINNIKLAEKDDSWYVWIPDIGMTVKGNNRSDAIQKAKHVIRGESWVKPTESVLTEQMLAPWVQNGLLSFDAQDEQYICYKTRLKRPLTLPKRFPSLVEMLDTLFQNPHFRALIHKYPKEATLESLLGQEKIRL